MIITIVGRKNAFQLTSNSFHINFKDRTHTLLSAVFHNEILTKSFSKDVTPEKQTNSGITLLCNQHLFWWLCLTQSA